MKFLPIVLFLFSFSFSEETLHYPTYPLQMNQAQEKDFHSSFVQKHTKLQDLSPLRLDEPNNIFIKETVPWKTNTLASIELGYVWKTIPYKFHGALRYIFIILHPESDTLALYEIGTDRYFHHIKTFDRNLTKAGGTMKHAVLNNKYYYIEVNSTHETFRYTLNSKKKMQKTKPIKQYEFYTDSNYSVTVSHDGTMSLTADKNKEHSWNDNVFSYELKVTYSNKQEDILFSYRVMNGNDGWIIGTKQFSPNDSKIYFDNSGGFACIWKYTFKGKILEKIVPEHETELIKVFSYKKKDYVLYVEEKDDKTIFKLATEDMLSFF